MVKSSFRQALGSKKSSGFIFLSLYLFLLTFSVFALEPGISANMTQSNVKLNNSRIQHKTAQSDIIRQEKKNDLSDITDGKKMPSWLAALGNNKKSDSGSTVSLVNKRESTYISEILKSHNEEIQSCYAHQLKINPEIKGKIDVRIFIKPDGYVKDVKVVETTITSPDFEQLLIDEMKCWNNFGPCSDKKTKVYRQEYVFEN